MEGFMVNTTNVNNHAYDIQGYGKQVKELQGSVRSIRSSMRHKLSAREQIDSTLRKIEDRLLEEAVLMSSLEQALEHIAESYRGTERKLVTEGIRRSAGGQEVTAQQQEMMDQYMRAAIFDIMQEERFSQEAWENASIEERKEILNDFLDRMEKEMGISLGDIEFRNGAGLDYNGAYNYKDDHIAFNDELLKNGDPNEALTTLMHEARHAYQYEACENPDRFMVTEETIQSWQGGFADYQDRLKRGEYSKVANEIDAHAFAGQELKEEYVSLTGGIGNGAEMYSKRAVIGSGKEYTRENGTVGYGKDMRPSNAMIMEYGLIRDNKSDPWYQREYEWCGYDKYVGKAVVGEDGRLYSVHNNDGYSDITYREENIQTVTFYIGKDSNPGTRGVVKMDTGGGIITAETIHFDVTDKDVSWINDKDAARFVESMKDAPPSTNPFNGDLWEWGLREYGSGFGVDQGLNIYIAMKNKSLNPAVAGEAFGRWFVSQAESMGREAVGDPSASVKSTTRGTILQD